MKRCLRIFRYLCFILGICAFLYPLASESWNQGRRSQVVAGYEKAVQEMEGKRKEEQLKEAEYYNKLLLAKTLFPTKIPAGSTEQIYPEILNLDANGMMGYIEIPRIRVKLPIYHGTDHFAISNGAGHLEGSSAPVGGEGTHSVLSSHRGLPGARLFTDLDKLEKGDIFQITVLDRTIFYEVDAIRTVRPEETEWMKIEKGKEYCTLLTCTPYGINTHRLLVRGVRVKEKKVQTEKEEKHWFWYRITGAFLIFILLLLGLGKNARAETADGFEKERNGKIEVVCMEDEKAICGITIQMCKVAEISMEGEKIIWKWIVKNPFPEYERIPENRLREAAEILAKDKNKMISESRKTDTSGTAVFSNLEMGCYLIWQRKPQPSEEYWKMNPFFVVLPSEEEGEWKTEARALPKMKKEHKKEENRKKNPAVNTGDAGKTGGYILCASGAAVAMAGAYKRKRGKYEYHTDRKPGNGG